MPFTPSHAVVALPFVRSPLTPAAIAVGAMTPDLPLFTRGIGLSYGFTHAATNIVWTTLVAFALLVLWRVVLRPALVELAPDALAARLPGSWRQTGRQALGELIAPGERAGARPLLPVLLLIVSLMLGVLSHIVWDLFTHEGRWGAETFPVLQELWGPAPGYKWLQHGSSILGLLIIGVFALRWLRRRPVRSLPRSLPVWVRWSWYLALPVLLIGAWVLGLALLGPISAEFTLQHLAYRTLPVACGIWGALTIVLCVVVLLGAERTVPGREGSVRTGRRVGES